MRASLASMQAAVLADGIYIGGGFLLLVIVIIIIVLLLRGRRL